MRESNDFATVLMDRNGDSVSENTGGLASFSCILPRTTKDFLKRFPAETWKPGDVVVTNGSQQLLYLVSEALCDPGDIVLVEDPTYFVYLGIVEALGIRAAARPVAGKGWAG